jgi:hypothetical protein
VVLAPQQVDGSTASASTPPNVEATSIAAPGVLDPDSAAARRTRTTLSTPAPRLVGVLAASDPRYSRAIFADESGRSAIYAVGDLVAPGVLLDQVEATFVVLNRGGRADVVGLRTGTPALGAVTLANPTARAVDPMPLGSGPRVGSDELVGRRVDALRRATSAAPPPPPALAPVEAMPQRDADGPKTMTLQGRKSR